MAGPKILSLFSGVGGIELAIGLAFPGSEVVGYVERDSYAAAALMARMEESSMDLAPVFCGEIQDVDGRELRGHVDVVCGGIPCQPYSVAGSQLGNKDERALWEEFARIVEECQPAMVFIENVPTFVTAGGFRPLGEELCRLGFDVCDPLFIGAADVGAPHLRRRVFILAYRNIDGSEEQRRVRELLEGVGAAQWDDADGCNEKLADGESERGRAEDSQESTIPREDSREVAGSGGGDLADAEGVSGGRDEQERGTQRGGPPRGSGEELADAGGSRREGSEQRGALSGDGRGEEAHGSASELHSAQRRPVGEGGVPDAVGDEVRDEPERGRGSAREAERRDPVSGNLGIFPPGPDDERWEDVISVACHLAPAIEPELRFVVDGVPVVLDESRADQLRCAGNAVVVAQALIAFRQLLQWTEKGEQ